MSSSTPASSPTGDLRRLGDARNQPPTTAASTGTHTGPWPVDACSACACAGDAHRTTSRPAGRAVAMALPAATVLAERRIGHDEQLGVRLGVAVRTVGPVRPVERDTGRAFVLVAEVTVDLQVSRLRQGEHADLVVAVDARARDEVVAHRDAARRLRLGVRPVRESPEVVQRGPVRTT